jgi:hypothetical protein
MLFQVQSDGEINICYYIAIDPYDGRIYLLSSEFIATVAHDAGMIVIPC